jgi:hypothetical protein
MVARQQYKRRPTPAPLARATGSILDLIGLRDIQEGCLCLHPNTITGKKSKQHELEYKAVLAVEPINFMLMSEQEQEAILESFRRLLTRLSTNEQISIHVRVLPYDLQPYLAKLEEAKTHSSSELVSTMAQDHKVFLQKLASRHAILQREFYVRVGIVLDKSQQRFKRYKLSPQEIFERAKTLLDQKCQDLLSDIQAAGLAASRLDDYELAQYYLSCVHSRYATDYPIQPTHLFAHDRPARSLRLADIENMSADSPVTEERTPPPAPTAAVPAIVPHDPVPGVARWEALDLSDLPSESDTPPSLPVSSETGKKPGWFGKKFATKPSEKKGHKKDRGSNIRSAYTMLSELVQPSLIEQREHYIRLYRESSEYFRARSVEGYPAFVVAGWMDRLIQIDEPYVDLVMFIGTLDPIQYTNLLSRKLTGYVATQRIESQAGRVDDPHITEARQDVEDLRAKIVQQVEHVHAVSLYVCARGSSLEELKSRDGKIVSLLRSLDMDNVELSLQHLQAWQCVLPDARDVLARHKILDTSSVVTAFPFASTSLSTEPGSLVGVMPSGSLVIIDPSSSQLDNGHEIKFAKSGAGKSYHEKVTLMRRLLMGYASVVVDPENEYASLCEQFDGASVRLSSGSLQINPFDLPRSDSKDRNTLEEKFNSLLVLFDLLLADRTPGPGTLNQREKSYLAKCVTRTYADCGITTDVSTHTKQPPCMMDLYAVMKSGVCGRDEFDLADRLLRHLSAFPQETQVQLDNPLVVFNIRDLSDELRPVGVFSIVEHVWTQVRSEKRPHKRQLIIDEGWALLQYPESGRHLAELCRRARKYNLSLRITSQMVEDFLGTEAGRVILTNASMKFLMKQDPASIDEITRAFHLSDGERKYLLSCGRGEGLFFANQSHVPLKVVASEIEHHIATTNPQEIEEQERKREEEQAANKRTVKMEAIAVEARANEYTVVMPHFYEQRSNTERSS